MTYERSDILNWLYKYFPIDKINGNEVNFPCPYCEHKAFYFNIAKSLGFCHHDICHRRVNLEDLIDIVGSEPEAFSGYVPIKSTPPIETSISLPATAVPIVDSMDEWVIACLKHRNVTWESIKKFNIHSNAVMIYVPVYLDNKLVEYVGRSIDRSLPPEQGFKKTGKRYLYRSGSKISHHFFGWDECKLWNELVLVENTFNSIWLRDIFHCTTNFGSHLSKEQIQKLIKSNVKNVVLLWDEGAQLRSESAVRSLKKAGIPSISIKIMGQPDDHSIETLKAIIEKARMILLQNPEVNFLNGTNNS